MKTLILVLLIAGTALTGCASGPKTVDPRAVYIWPLDTCPSAPPVTGAAPRFAAAGAGVIAALGGDLINAALAVPFAALSNAAQADKNGFSVTNTQNRNYYTLTDGGHVTQPGCFIVAYAAPARGHGSWCNDPNFKASVSGCNTGLPKIDSLPVREPLFIEQADGNKQKFALDPLEASGNDIKSRLDLPEFYVELALRSSPGTSNIVALEPVAMFYPNSLIDKASCAVENDQGCSRRMLVLTISLLGAAPGGSSTPAKFGITFPAITPSPRLTNTTWSAASSISWTALPPLDPTSITKGITDDGFASLAGAHPAGNDIRIYPVSIGVTLTESKNPNIYLQALNGAFNQQAQSQIATAITNGISFGGVPSVDAQTTAKAANQVLTDQASVAAALATVVKDCSTPALANADLAALTAKENQANLDATLAGQPQLYPDTKADGRKACPAACSAGSPNC